MAAFLTTPSRQGYNGEGIEALGASIYGSGGLRNGSHLYRVSIDRRASRYFLGSLYWASM